MTDVSLIVADFDSGGPEQIFFTALATGTPLYLAGIEAGWSPGELDRKMRDQAFKAMVDSAADIVDDEIEAVLLKKAREGRQWAVEKWLSSRRPDRWGEKKRVEIDAHGKLDITEVRTVKEALIGAVRESGDPASVIRAVQQRALEASARELPHGDEGD